MSVKTMATPNDKNFTVGFPVGNQYLGHSLRVSESWRCWLAYGSPLGVVSSAS
jgi:hypothetical protein